MKTCSLHPGILECLDSSVVPGYAPPKDHESMNLVGIFLSCFEVQMKNREISTAKPDSTQHIIPSVKFSRFKFRILHPGQNIQPLEGPCNQGGKMTWAAPAPQDFSFSYSGDIGEVCGASLGDCWGGFWDMFGICWMDFDLCLHSFREGFQRSANP